MSRPNKDDVTTLKVAATVATLSVVLASSTYFSRQSLKCDEKFLYGLLTLSQEQSIKTGRFAMIYADTCIPNLLQ